MYEPKKEKYNDLRALVKEMQADKVKILSDDGGSITIKGGHKYTLYDGEIVVSNGGKR